LAESKNSLVLIKKKDEKVYNRKMHKYKIKNAARNWRVEDYPSWLIKMQNRSHPVIKPSKFISE